MGVLRNRRYDPIRIEDFDIDDAANNYANFLFDSDFSDSEPEQTQVPLTKYEYESSQRRKKVKHCRRAYGPIELIDGLPVKRNMGAQKWRRVENAKLIMNFADMQDVCYDGSDLIEETITAFSRLLRDEAKMRIWNEFIELNEEGQTKMIEKIEKEIADDNAKTNLSGSSNKLSGKRDHHQPEQGDKRKNHPAFSAETCFQRLDKKLRDCLLKRRYIQYDYMKKVEGILRGYFSESSSGVYFEEIACRVKRFYTHAVAQFLQLKSQTMDGADSKKLVQVENEKDTFAPPELFLVAFLRKKRRARRAARHGDDNWEEVEGGEL